MIAILGLLLMLAGAAAVVGVASSTATAHVDVFGMSVGTHNVAAVFAAGAVAGLAFAMGLMLLRDGVIRSRRRRVAARDEAAANEREAQALRSRNAELEWSMTHGQQADPHAAAGARYNDGTPVSAGSGRHAR